MASSKKVDFVWRSRIMISLKTQFSKQGKHNDGRKTLYGMIFDIIISLRKMF